MEKKVSVIIPVYNTQHDLIRCIDSLRNQTLQEWEAICVDDGSTDDSGKILDEIARTDPRFKIIHQKNSGVACARNTALEHVAAPYVTMLDSDDYLQHDALERMLLFFRDQAVEIVIAAQGAKKKDGKISHSLPFLPPGLLDFKIEYFFVSFHPAPWAKLYKMDIIKKHNIRFPEGIKMGEDAVFVAQYCSYVRRAYVLHDPLYVYDLSSQTSVSQKFNSGMLSYEVYSQTLGLAALIYRLISERGDSLYGIKAWQQHLLKIHLIEHNWVINFTRHSSLIKRRLRKVSRDYYSQIAKNVACGVRLCLSLESCYSLFKGKLMRFAGKVKRMIFPKKSI
ncbi:MAG: glycosyltransferase family 2 protein [Akkermansia sp.]|nr:glycosyltransferase family 2 protein [Akkermansia sp.]